MKKIYSIVLMAAALLVGTNAWATSVNTWDGLKAALQAGGEVTLSANINVTADNVATWDGIWMGTVNEDDTNAPKATLDLAGYNITIYSGEYKKKATQSGYSEQAINPFILTKGSLKIISSSPAEIKVVEEHSGLSKSTNVFSVFGSGEENKVDPKGNNPFSYLEIGENVSVSTINGTVIAIDDIQPSQAAIKALPSGEKPSYQTVKVTGKAAGWAYGVSVEVKGNLTSKGTNSTVSDGKKCYGIKVNGNVATPDATNKPYAPYIHVAEGAVLESDYRSDMAGSAAVYASGYGQWLIEGTCQGATGVYSGAGVIEIYNAEVKSAAEVYNAAGSGGHANGSGSAVVVNSRTNYPGELEMTISGESRITGQAGYAIEEQVNTTPDPETGQKETKVDNITIEGGTIQGGAQGAIIVSEETIKDPEADVVIYGGDVTGTTQAGKSGDLNDLTPATGYHTTEVIVDGKTTIVVSQGDGPKVANSVIGATEYAAIKWQNTGTTEETLNKDLTLTELEINEAYAQTLTVAAGKKLIVGHVILGENAKIIVKPGAKFIATDKDGIAAQTVSNIVLESSETAQAVLLMNPAVTNHTNPKATVEMTVLKGMEGTESAWTRFAMPLQTLSSLKRKHAYETWIYGWDYAAKGGQGDWALLANVNDMKSWIGYTLSYDNAGEQVYTFEGNLAGNANAPLKFVHKGYNYFGNSYSSFIDAKTLVENLPADVDGSIWMWDVKEQSYASVPMNILKNKAETLKDDEAWKKDVAPMTTFILRLMDKDNAAASVDYASAIWSNPRYGNAAASSSNPAPARASMENAYIKMIVTAANGKSDRINLTENAAFSDAYDRGYDAAKYMNENRVNLYATINGENLSDVVTNDLEGKTINLQTIDEIAYTISFKNVEGSEYALFDKVANQIIAIEEGATYEFAAQPNSTVEGRFEIVRGNKVATSIENTEVKANVKGIYTMTGQYVGEDFEVLPAGVYVVNGVKIVK